MVVRYEDLHTDTAATLRRVVEHVTQQVLPDYVAEFAVKRNSFKEKTGREPGMSDASSSGSSRDNQLVSSQSDEKRRIQFMGDVEGGMRLEGNGAKL